MFRNRAVNSSTDTESKLGDTSKQNTYAVAGDETGAAISRTRLVRVPLFHSLNVRFLSHSLLFYLTQVIYFVSFASRENNRDAAFTTLKVPKNVSLQNVKRENNIFGIRPPSIRFSAFTQIWIRISMSMDSYLNIASRRRRRRSFHHPRGIYGCLYE